MRAASRLTVFIATGVILAAAAAAQTPDQQPLIDRQKQNFERVLSRTNKECGSSMTGSVDWPGLLAANPGRNSIGGYCSEALATMMQMCARPDWKQGIAAKIRSYTCGFGGPGKRALSLKGGELHMDIDWAAPNYDIFVREWLAKHL